MAIQKLHIFIVAAVAVLVIGLLVWPAPTEPTITQPVEVTQHEPPQHVVQDNKVHLELSMGM